MKENTIYSVADCRGLTPRQVVDQFANLYWDWPRRVDTIEEDGTFHLSDGSRVYKITYNEMNLVKGERARYEIDVL